MFWRACTVSRADDSKDNIDFESAVCMCIVRLRSLPDCVPSVIRRRSSQGPMLCFTGRGDERQNFIATLLLTAADDDRTVLITLYFASLNHGFTRLNQSRRPAVEYRTLCWSTVCVRLDDWWIWWIQDTSKNMHWSRFLDHPVYQRHGNERFNDFHGGASWWSSSGDDRTAISARSWTDYEFEQIQRLWELRELLEANKPKKPYKLAFV